jgi:hypothetical protein
MQLVTVELNSETISVPTPPIDFDFRELALPTIGPFGLPDIEIQPISFTIPLPDIDDREIDIPTIDIDEDTILLPDIPEIPVPLVTFPRLTFDTFEVDLRIAEITLIDVFSLRLEGGDVDLVDRGGGRLGTIDVPEIDVDSTEADVPTIGLEDETFTVPGFSQEFPTVGPVELPSLAIPTAFRLTGSLSVVDPLSLGVTVETNFDPLRQEIFGAFPDGLLSDPIVWSFETAVSGFQSLIGSGAGTTIKNAVDAFLDAALESDTKERLQSRNRDDET